jgi:superfamily II DNA or RNA helicase
MSISEGFIYVRVHESYDIYNCCKLGKASNIVERDSQYATSEVRRGKFKMVVKVEYKKMGIIERLLQYEFREYHKKYDGGIEFYDKAIIDLIEPCLTKYSIKYKILSDIEVSELTRSNRVRQTIVKINKKLLLDALRSCSVKKEIFIPRDNQQIIINNAVKYFERKDKGLLILTCGFGKTLISLWISRALGAKRILIGVPNCLLLNQWQDIVRVLFQDIPCLQVSGETTIDEISDFCEKNRESCVVITTYSSSFKVRRVTEDSTFLFDMKINDEVHHLTSSNIDETKRQYTQIMKIPCVKQLSLTATIKQVEGTGEVISNDDVKYFGEVIERRCVLFAIQENIICDYVIQTIVSDEDKIENELVRFNILDDNDKRLFLSAFCGLKSIYEGHSHHLLIYANTMESSMKIIKFVDMLMKNKYFELDELYYSSYNSSLDLDLKNDILLNFDNSKYGIITCVFCLGEGWDNPLLDGVVFSENMTSNIRIVQASLRAFRKNKYDVNKKAKIILPILIKDDVFENSANSVNSDLKKIREVIYQMGLEDETISQKIKVCKIRVEKQKLGVVDKGNIEIFGEYDADLTKKLRLKTMKRVSGSITYEKAKKIISEKNIKSKESYYDLCKKDDRLCKDPEIVFKGQFTNWIEYLSIERVYYDLETCKTKVSEYLIKYPDIRKYYLDLSMICKELCKIDNLFPPSGLWVEYYDLKDLQEIICISGKKKKSGVIF